MKNSMQMWRFPPKLRIDLPYDSAIPFLCISPNNTKTLIWRNICTSIFPEILFIIAEIWKKLKCPSGFPDGSAGKASAYNARDTGDIVLIPGSGRSPGGGKWQPTQTLLPEKPHGQDKSPLCWGTWRTTVPGTSESDTTEWLTLSLLDLFYVY